MTFIIYFSFIQRETPSVRCRFKYILRLPITQSQVKIKLHWTFNTWLIYDLCPSGFVFDTIKWLLIAFGCDWISNFSSYHKIDLESSPWTNFARIVCNILRLLVFWLEEKRGGVRKLIKSTLCRPICGWMDIDRADQQKLHISELYLL